MVNPGGGWWILGYAYHGRISKMLREEFCVCICLCHLGKIVGWS